MDARMGPRGLAHELQDASLPWDDGDPMAASPAADDPGSGDGGRVSGARVHEHQRYAMWTAHDASRRRPRGRAEGGRLQALLTHMRHDTLRPAVAAAPPRVGAAKLAPAGAATGASTQFAPVEQHFKIPHGVFMREATAVGVDSEDNVFVFNRGNIPVLVFSRSGDLIDQWGNPTPYEGTEELDDDSFKLFGPTFTLSRWRGSEFMRPHAIFVDHEDNLWLV